MKVPVTVLFALLVVALALSACEQATPTATILNPLPPEPGAAAETPIGNQEPTSEAPPENGAQETPAANPAATPTLPAAQEAYCKNGGALSVAANEPLAAKVNDQPIPLALYQRQAEQQKQALIAQGLDPNSQEGKDALKSLQQQVLGQLIDNVIVEQAAKSANLNVTDADVNNRIQQMINDAGGRPKFDDYLKNTQMTLDDLCIQIRASIFGELMLDKETANVPTKAEQVHVAQILLSSQAEAEQVEAQLKAGKDFAALAKQYSQDEATRDNGGDLGWIPRGMMPLEFENAAFALKPGEVSGIVATPLGIHIIKVLERDPAHELSPDMLQQQKQQAFIAWLDGQRNQAKIEKLVNP